MSALDELLGKWRSNPDAGATLALCAYLSGVQREDLVREVGATAEAWHSADGDVMLAVGRMYLDSLMLPEAQAALVASGKVSESDPRPFRYLGEVLLRRGDAIRAEKVLARALGLGDVSADTRTWHDRAQVFVALQTRVGMQAVQDEVARALPKKTSIPPPSLSAAAHRPPRGPKPPSVPPPPRLVAEVPPVLAAHAATLPDSSEVSGTVPVLRPAPTAGAPPPSRRIGRGASSPVAVEAEVPPALAPPPASSARPHASPPARQRPPLAFGPEDSAQASPEVVLTHLEQVGLFERGGGAQPAWEKGKAERSRGAWIFVVAVVMVLGAGGGGYVFAQERQARRMASARALETEAAELLETGNLADLRATDDQLSRVFELDSRSQRAAVLWLENRVLTALLAPGEAGGIESAILRCETLGVEPAEIAFGRIASFLAEGDLAGAAAQLPRWDEKAAADGKYHLVAAMMLERAGDIRAIGRYKKAVEADDDLIIAKALRAQSVALELGAEEAKPFVEQAREAAGPVLSKALGALLWAVEQPRPETVPDEARFSAEERAALPIVFGYLPPALQSLSANDEDAKVALETSLAKSTTPASATWVGMLALERGLATVGRQAALKALGYSGLYPRARALAARVALLDARLADAEKAIQELDPQTTEVAVVRAAVAYETLNLASLEAAIGALGEGASDMPYGRALGRSLDVAMGQGEFDPEQFGELVKPDVPWGPLVAVDAALDQGDVERAASVVDDWGERRAVPVYALRVARLERYRGNEDAAVAASDATVSSGGITPRILVERTLDLIAAKRLDDAREFLAKYRAVLGPTTGWLEAHVDIMSGKGARAKAFIGGLEEPPEEAPLTVRVVAALPLALVRDRRAKDYIKALLAVRPEHPDVVAAARRAGLRR